MGIIKCKNIYLYHVQEYQRNLLAHQAWLAKEVCGLDKQRPAFFSQEYHSQLLIHMTCQAWCTAACGLLLDMALALKAGVSLAPKYCSRCRSLPVRSETAIWSQISSCP